MLVAEAPVAEVPGVVGDGRLASGATDAEALNPVG